MKISYLFSFYRTRAFWRVLRLTMAVIFRHLTIAFSRKISTTPSRKTWAFFESISTMKMSPGTWSNFTQCWLPPAREEQRLLQVKLKMAPPVKVSLVLQHLSLHSVRFLGTMKIKFYWKNISTTVIFEKKKFQFMCHMIGLYHYWG